MDEPSVGGDVPDHPEPPADASSVEPDELYRAIDAREPVRLLDVRNRDEVDAWHIDGPSVTATHVPLSRFLQAQVTETVDELADEIDGEGPITAVCAEGEASDYVAGLLVDAGIEARNLADGMEGWARVYRATTLASDPTIIQYFRPASGCLAYMVVDAGEAVVVDSLRAVTDRYLADADEREADVVAVVDTHLHADHVSGLRDLVDATGAIGHMPAESVGRGVTHEVSGFVDGDRLHVGDATLRAVALPGHTTGMTGIRVGDVLLAGDSLFLDGVARPDLQVADPDDQAALAAQLHRTITERLREIDDDVLVAPGHVGEAVAANDDGTYAAQLGALRDRLPVFDVDESTFVERILANPPPRPANAERIIDVNRGAEAIDDATAFALELGPNNCAAGTFQG